MSRRVIMPARNPSGPWPVQMRADMTAAFLDYPDTKSLAQAVARGEAPPPSALRGCGPRREPIWNRFDVEAFLARDAKPRQDATPNTASLADLV